MQVPYHINLSLQDYYKSFGKWPIPKFSYKCPICGSADCATCHGYYTRIVICPLTGFSVLDFPILRFLCHNKGVRKCDHVTFSLLPIELVPFRQLTLEFMILAVYIRLNKQFSLTNALGVIEEKLNKLDDVADFINISTLMSWERLILAAFALYLSSGCKELCKIDQYKHILSYDTNLLLFLVTIKKYTSLNTNNPIRGPAAFAQEFYKQLGGTDKLALFLFGRASQHRS